MAVPGAIAERARGILPVTWDALSRDTQRFGDGLLEDKIDLVKEALFGTVIPATDEDDHPLRVIDYAAKMVAYELISPGIDFWMNEVIQESASGTNETHAWIDRAEKLRLLGERLGWEIRRDEPMIFGLLGRKPALKRIPIMGISTPADDVLLTPNPREFPAPYRQGTGVQRLT